MTAALLEDSFENNTETIFSKTRFTLKVPFINILLPELRISMIIFFIDTA